MSFAAQTSYIRVSEKTRPKIGTFFKSFFFFYDLNLSSYVQKVVGNKPFYKFRSAERYLKQSIYHVMVWKLRGNCRMFWNLAKIIYINNQTNFVHKSCVCIKKKYNWLRVVLKSYTQEWNSLLRKVRNTQYRIIISVLGSDSDTTESISNSLLLSLHYVCTLIM